MPPTARTSAWAWWVAYCKARYPDVATDEQAFALLLKEYASIIAGK